MTYVNHAGLIIVETLPRPQREWLYKACQESPLLCEWDEDEGFVVTFDELVMMMGSANFPGVWGVCS
jgi:hypothetical protein